MPDVGEAVYDPVTRTYTLDGRTYNETDVLRLLENFERRQQRQAEELVRAYLRSGNTAVFEEGMRQLIKDTFITNYVLGYGGRNSMTQADWGRLGQLIRTQYAYLAGFVASLSDQTPAQMLARARLYANSARTAYWSATGQAWSIRLPAQPGDGSTACKMNCRCLWRIEDQGEGIIHAYWVLGQAEHCSDCVMRSQMWAPFVAYRTEVPRVRTVNR